MVSRKGQVTSLDVAVSTIVILILTATAFTHTINELKHSNKKHLQIELDKEAYESTESLLSSPGIPTNWQEIDKEIERIGLAKYSKNSVQHHDLDLEKVDKLKEFTLKELTEKIGIQNKVTSIEITSIQTGQTKVNKKTEADKLKETRRITRAALINGELFKLELSVSK